MTTFFITPHGQFYTGDLQPGDRLATEDEVTAFFVDKCTYAELRAAAYPDMTEQLDKLYHDIDGGLFGDTAKTSAFYLARKEVKETYPKAVESEVDEGENPVDELVESGSLTEDESANSIHSAEGHDSLEHVVNADVQTDSTQVLSPAESEVS